MNSITNNPNGRALQNHMKSKKNIQRNKSCKKCGKDTWKKTIWNKIGWRKWLLLIIAGLITMLAALFPGWGSCTIGLMIIVFSCGGLLFSLRWLCGTCERPGWKRRGQRIVRGIAIAILCCTTSFVGIVGFFKLDGNKQIDPSLSGMGTGIVAYFFYGKGNYPVAENLYNRALKISRAKLTEDANPLVIETITNQMESLGIIYNETGRFAKAEQYHKQVQERRRIALGPNHPDVSSSIVNLANVYQNNGRIDKAEQLLKQALKIDKNLYGLDHLNVTRDMNDLANTFIDKGEYTEAERLYIQALKILARIQERDHQFFSKVTNNLALLYFLTGRYSEAEKLNKQVLAKRKKILGQNHPSIASSMNNLAAVYIKTERYTEAEQFLGQALKIQKETLGQEHPLVAVTMSNLSIVYFETKRYTEAEQLNKQVLEIRKKILSQEHPDVAVSLNNLAEVYCSTENFAKAETLLHQALFIANKAGRPTTRYHVQSSMAELLAKQDNPAAAIFFAKHAVNTAQLLRQNVTALGKDVQKSFLATKEETYHLLIDLLIEEGRLPEAQQVMAMLKEDEFFSFVRRDRKAASNDTKTNYNEFEAEQLARYQAISSRLAGLGKEYGSLNQIKPYARTTEQKARISVLRADMDIASAKFQQALTEINLAFAGLTTERQKELATKQLDNDERGLVKDLSNKSGQNVALIHYLILKDKVRILLTTPDILLARDANIESKELNQQIQDLRASLMNPDLNPQPQSKKLYDLLIKPIAADLQQAKTKTIMLSLDSTLRYLPFSILYDGEHYLVEQYGLSIFTPAARDRLKDDPQAEWYVAGLGLSQQIEGYNPLPAVKEELNSIVRQNDADPEGVLPGIIHLDEDFNRTSMRTSLADRYPVFHIASHFVFKPGVDKNSFLLLGNGKTLDLGEIREKDYNFTAVDLLTLSACETAMGDRDAKGKEIEGFGTLAQKKGAKGVLATLWPVADSSTGKFMQNLYQMRQTQHLTKAEALRQAQLAFINGNQTGRNNASIDGKRGFSVPSRNKTAHSATSFGTDPEAPYRHPYYWAPFILMGNWL